MSEGRRSFHLFYDFFSGRQPDELKEEADKMVEDLVLSHKRNEISKNLSGGMQRKLSIATAFVGGSQTVILDEPTAGVDPFSRYLFLRVRWVMEFGTRSIKISLNLSIKEMEFKKITVFCELI